MHYFIYANTKYLSECLFGILINQTLSVKPTTSIYSCSDVAQVKDEMHENSGPFVDKQDVQCGRIVFF